MMSNISTKLQSRKTFSSWHIPEPSLIFGDGKTHIDPKSGLELYGPHKTSDGQSATPLSINVGIIGTGHTVGLAKHFLDKLSRKIENKDYEPFQSPPFPGFKIAFNCELIVPDAIVYTLEHRQIKSVLDHVGFEDKVESAVNLFGERIEAFTEVVPKPRVVLCALPQEIIDYCAAKKTSGGEMVAKTTRKEKKLVEKLQKYREDHQTLLGGLDIDKILEDNITKSNLWRGLKAKGMKYGMPTQIAWPSTLTPSNEPTARKRQADSSIAWNMSVGLYYKGSGFPWTMTRMERGTCYVGISFFRDSSSVNKMRTSTAQIFTYTGQGLVLRGDEFEWDTKRGKSPHLTADAANSLLNRVIKLYKTRMGEQPTRVVVHKSSKYWEEEKLGFQDALKNIARYDLVAFGQRRIQFFRYGQYPPLRGTVIKTGANSFLLYTRGYVPYLRTYPGPHIPLPLEVVETHGSSDPQTILSEILALSKMNWNSAEFSLEKPITLLFSERVGSVMADTDERDLKHEYLYYM